MSEAKTRWVIASRSVFQATDQIFVAVLKRTRQPLQLVHDNMIHGKLVVTPTVCNVVKVWLLLGELGNIFQHGKHFVYQSRSN